MRNAKPITRLGIWELLFQLVLLAMVFIFYCFDYRDSSIEEYEIAFFLNYAVAATLINYLLLPRFLYQKRYLHFTIYVVLLIGIVIFIEEAVIENIYFPTTRGANFPGLFYNLASAMPTITILAGFKFAWDALTTQREVERLKRAVIESELQFLKSQINPHFLFNNLNNLYAYALEQSPNTPQIILELSAVLRYMLYECQEKYVPLHKEITQLENFVNLSRLQFEERGTVTFSAQGTQGHYQIAPLILTVFVENAFKHSLSSQTEGIMVSISLTVSEQGTLQFVCTNKYSEETNTRDLSRGIGLSNVKKRLDMLYPNAYELDISTHQGTYRVALRLQLQSG